MTPTAPATTAPILPVAYVVMLGSCTIATAPVAIWGNAAARRLAIADADATGGEWFASFDIR